MLESINGTSFTLYVDDSAPEVGGWVGGWVSGWMDGWIDVGGGDSTVRSESSNLMTTTHAYISQTPFLIPFVSLVRYVDT